MSTSSHELDAPPWLRVELTLMATARAIRQAYDRRLGGVGVNLSEASLLAFVSESGPVSQTRLAERLGLGRAATGAAVDRLEAAGLVERQPDPDDRRVWLVTSTPSGDETIERVNGIDQELRAELRAGITREERQALAKTLVRLQENLAGLSDQPN